LICQDKADLRELYPQTFYGDSIEPEVFAARRFPNRLHYRIVRCRNCGLVFAREILPPETIEYLYSRSHILLKEYSGIIGNDYWCHLKPFLNGVPRGKALEIGCSDGFFLEILLEHGFQEAYGCEPSEEARNTAGPRIKNNIKGGLFRDGLFGESMFDLVCSFQTLDHVPDPREMVRVCHAVLKPGGLAYFIVHDTGSLQYKILGERSPIINIQHIYLFNKKNLSRLFEQQKFEVIKVSNLRNSYPISYWMRLMGWEKRARLAERLGIGSLRILIPAGNIAIVAKCIK
jgi:SAM-dependent methyltransferase